MHHALDHARLVALRPSDRRLRELLDRDRDGLVVRVDGGHRVERELVWRGDVDGVRAVVHGDWNTPRGRLDGHLVARDLHAVDLDFRRDDDRELRELGLELGFLLLRELFELGLALAPAETDGVEVRSPRARQLAGLFVAVTEVEQRADAGDRVVARLEARAGRVVVLVVELFLPLLNKVLAVAMAWKFGDSCCA